MDNSARDYEKFRLGDAEGLSNIIRDHKDGLILYLNGFVQDISVAEELTEETFVKLVLKQPNFSSYSSFKTWLYAIGRNIALSYIRHRKMIAIPLENCSEFIADEIDLERDYLRKEEQLVLYDAMKRLKPEYRQVLWLVYFEGFTNKETARIMGKTVHNMETLVYRARKALKLILLEEGFVYEKL